MANNWWESDPVATVSADEWWASDPIAGEQKAKEAGIVDRLKDTGIDAVKGVVGAGEALVGVGNLVSGNLVGDGLAKIGFDPKRTKEILSSGYSEERQAENAAVRDAEGFVGTARSLLENPAVAVGSMVESAPMMLGSAGAVRAVAGGMLARAGIAPGTAAAAEFLKRPEVLAKLATVGSAAEGATTAGSIQEQARQEGSGYADSAGYALAGGAGTALIGKAASKLLPDADVIAGTLGMGGRSSGAGFLGAAKGIGKGMVQEGALEEMPQSAQEQVFTNLATSKPWNEGVAESAAQGLIVGAAMGGGVNLVDATSRRRAAAEQALQQAPDAASAAAAANKMASVDLNAAVNEVEQAVSAYLRPDGGIPTPGQAMAPQTIQTPQPLVPVQGGFVVRMPQNMSGTPSATMGTRTDAKAGPGFTAADVVRRDAVETSAIERMLAADIPQAAAQEVAPAVATPTPDLAQASAQEQAITQPAEAEKPPANLPRPSRILGQPTSSYTDDQLTRMIEQPDIPAVSRRGASIELSARQAAQPQAAQQAATLTNEGTMAQPARVLEQPQPQPAPVLEQPAMDATTLAAKQRWELRQAEEKQQAAQNQQENERYNAYVQKQEKDAERRRLQGDNIIQQANGKPFKTEASAQAKLDEFDLADTHAIQKTDKGFVLRRMPPAEQAERSRKAEGRESYMEAQSAVLAEMGIGETADGEIDATDEQFAEIERRTAERLGRKVQPADSKPNQPPAQQTPAVAATETVAPTTPIQLGRDQTLTSDEIMEDGRQDTTGALFSRSRGRNPQEETPEFKRWFGDSKVVDADGKPLVVYHGSASDFAAFDPAKQGTKNDKGYNGEGFYFSEDPDYASAYAEPSVIRGGDPVVYPVYVSIERPLIIGEGEGRQVWSDLGVVELGVAGAKEKTKAATSAGYDGVIVMRGEVMKEIIAFRPEQIKSATGNNGDFDPANPDIRRSAPRGSKLATPSDGRIVSTDATTTGKAPVPGSKHTVQDGDTSHSFTVVDASKLGPQGRLIQQIARIFGKRVVAFQSDTLQADGFVMNDDQTTIYLNVESTVSPLAVFGHELTHQMKKDNPQAYAALEAVVRRNMGEEGMAKFRQEYGEDADIEELSSDLVGNRFREPAFWEDVFNEIASQNPTGAAAIVQRVGQAIRKAVDTLLKTIRQQGFNADAYVTNLEEIRDAVRVAMVDYAKQQREPAMAGVKDAPVTDGKAKFSFAGRESKTADTRQLDEAQRLIAEGASPEAVRQQTGWFKGADGKWRYEINDADAKLLKEPSDPEVYADVFDEAANRSNGVPLTKVLDHPALFAAYPKLQAVRVMVDDKMDSDGSYSAEENAIRVRDPYSYQGGHDELLSVLLHEIQHGIQYVEGFATGGNPDRMREYAIEHGRKIVEAAYGDLPSYKKAKEEGRLDEWVMTALQASGKGISPYEAYRRLAGEVEARNTQARQKMTDSERQATSPSKTADVADSDVIVMFNGMVAKNVPPPANAQEGAQFSRKRTDTDAEYMAAVERGDMETAQKLVDQAALAAGYITANDYRMQHQAPNSQYDTSLANLREEGLVPDDYWTNPEWYQNTPEEMESWRKVKDAFRRMDAYKANGRNPGMAGIDVYRAVPKDVKDSEIRNGDWVTPSLAYAKNEGEMIPDGYRIIAQKVLAKDLYWDGNSMAELGYDDGQGYGYKNTKNNRKLVDVITRDDDGNIIALSKRFNSRVADTRFSRRRRNIFGQQVLPTWTAPTETKLDDFLYVMQDKMVDTKRVVEAVKGAIGRIDDQWNPYLQEELYHGRTATKTKQFLGDELRPLLQDMQSRGVGMADFEEYLHNRHAEERNRQIAKVNPGMPDGGSGIDTADARAYLAGLDPAKRRAYEALARRIDAITAGTRQLLVDNGLETQDTIDAWDAAYSQYVPLNREDLDFSSSFTSTGTGQGFSVKGAASKRATGSKRKVVDILANIAMQRERAIVRAEKNRVATAVYGLAASQPNTDFWLAVNPDAIKDPIGLRNELVKMGLNPLDAQNLIEEPTQTYIDPRTGLVSQRINPALRSSPNVLAVRVDGKDRYVFFNASDERSQRMVTALKNLDADQLGRVMGMAAQVTRWFASVNTQYNPIFGVINFMRDVQGATLQLSTTPIADKKAQVLGDVIPALRGIYADIRAERKGNARPGGTWATLWEEFQKEGAQTGYRDQFSKSAERAKALESELKRITEGKAKQFGRAMFDWLSDYNETMENAVRLAAYKAAKDNGLSNQQAASVAKNLTVNFNRKGQIATQAGALYAFFNAAIQGSTRMVQTLTGPAGKAIIGGGLLLGVIQAVMLAAAGYDDDEPPEFVRERGFIIPMDWLNNIGGPDLDGKYFTIPMPLGYNVIPNTSRVMTEFVLSGYRDPAKRVAQITGALLETFNPIGNAGWSVQTIAPTFADPLVALSENRDWTGKMIAKKDRSDTNPTPGYTRAKETASWFSKELSYYLNLASGGTKYKPGFLSPTPDQIDYLIGQVTGGVGREALKIEQTITSTVTGEELPPYKIPLAGRFYGDTRSASAESNRFYENITRLNEHENEIKGRRENRENPGEYLRENPEARLYQFANKIEQDVTKLRKRRRELLERGASKESIKMIETQITNRMKRLNDRVKAVQDAED